MIFNKHSDLTGKHAFLSASKYHWVNYDDEKLLDVFENAMTAALGTRLHAYAKEAIELGIRQAPTGQTLNMYINDCIGHFMQPEQLLVYSPNAFGTADAIDFDDKEKILRIFDLKNGVNKASDMQLLVYAAFFCLEYDKKPGELEFDLRIYQNDEIMVSDATSEDVAYMMDRVVYCDRIIEDAKKEV